MKILFNGLIMMMIVFTLTLNTLPGWSSLTSLCAAAFVFFLYVQSGSVYFLKVMVLPLMFAAYSILTVIWGGSLDYSQMVATAILVGMALLMGLNKKVVTLEAVTVALIIAGLMNIVFSRSSAMMGVDPDDIRVEGMVGNPNALSIFLSFTAFVMLFAPLKFPKITKLLAAYFIFYSLVFTGSRKGLMLAAMIILYGIISYAAAMKNSRGVIAFFAVGALACMAAVPYFYNLSQETSDVAVVSRTQHLLNGQHNVRFDMIAEGFRLWTLKPLTGWGAGQFAQLTVFQIYSHNNYVETLANYGLIGLFFYYGFYFSLIKKAIGKLFSRARQALEKQMSGAGLYMLLMFLISEWGLVTIGSKSAWIFIGIAAYFIINEHRPEPAVQTHKVKKNENSFIHSGI